MQFAGKRTISCRSCQKGSLFTTFMILDIFRFRRLFKQQYFRTNILIIPLQTGCGTNNVKIEKSRINWGEQNSSSLKLQQVDIMNSVQCEIAKQVQSSNNALLNPNQQYVNLNAIEPPINQIEQSNISVMLPEQFTADKTENQNESNKQDTNETELSSQNALIQTIRKQIPPHFFSNFAQISFKNAAPCSAVNQFISNQNFQFGPQLIDLVLNSQLIFKPSEFAFVFGTL
ncbi:Hypothetical_protein [Hexamita inflata]|uniref:Hypothetical_protein n=1 Tax=Hexamita inflata TaxID=28002 RepID=A0AA86TW51_9EUKA|nr:Hypothetical protein HINF_LOCUS11418 [Hexamita inflata]